jgi:uroporphyrin-III C-methyltransferase
LHSETLALLRGGDDAAATSVALSIEHSARDAGDQARIGEVVLAGAGPGDADLVTPATRAVLADADVVLHDALIGPDVLRLCGSRARCVDVGKRAGRASIGQAQINALMIDAARAGQLVVRLKGGDPFLFGRGGEEVAAVRAAGIRVRVIPGVSAALAAPAAADIPVTHRGVAGSVAIVTGHRAEGATADLERLAASVDTLVVMMPRGVDAIARQLSRVLGQDTPAAVISRATTAAQRVVRAPIGRIAAVARESRIEAPTTLVVGAVVDVLVASAESEMHASVATP